MVTPAEAEERLGEKPAPITPLVLQEYIFGTAGSCRHLPLGFRARLANTATEDFSLYFFPVFSPNLHSNCRMSTVFASYLPYFPNVLANLGLFTNDCCLLPSVPLKSVAHEGSNVPG